MIFISFSVGAIQNPLILLQSLGISAHMIKFVLKYYVRKRLIKSERLKILVDKMAGPVITCIM